MKNCDYLPEKSCICIRLRRMAHKVTELYDTALSAVGLSVNQYLLLVNIGKIEGCGTGELAKQVGQEKSTLVRTLQPLLRKELVIDKSSAKGRQRQLHLTPSGKSVLKKAFPLWEGAQRDIAGKLGENLDELMLFFDKIDL